MIKEAIINHIITELAQNKLVTKSKLIDEITSKFGIRHFKEVYARLTHDINDIVVELRNGDYSEDPSKEIWQVPAQGDWVIGTVDMISRIFPDIPIDDVAI